MPFGFGKGRRGADKTGGMSSSGSGRGYGRWGHGGPPTECVCPQCGLVAPREPGVPCFQRRCPQCGSFMARQFLKIE
ncbi:MAG: hypothetical protein BWX92_00363 [Deltaproteobacteria bacterium ADurb.Bin135]|jgi:hypothetical protein|nr:MAG: hypothetical protein BWX92_00363 [Deltaproteobacteria bacterium ADurb.Bin135]